jgi:sugar lactone lactonase YvrE
MLRKALVPSVAVLLSLAGCSDQSSSPSDALSGPNQTAAVPRSLLPGQVETILDLTPVVDIAEGIIVDDQGNIFVSNNRFERDTRVAEILKIAPDNTVSVFATLDSEILDLFKHGVGGLGLNSQGDLYAALPSFHPATHGVWRIRRDGVAQRLAGSRQMLLPNALIFDSSGNLYVTDSDDGAIWRFPPDGPGKLWIRHPVLAPDPNFGIGANGIAFVPPRNLFVANTDFALIARIPIKRNGDAGNPEVVASGFELLTIDGLAADVHGNLHAVLAGAAIFGTAPLVRVNPQTGGITASTTEWGEFDFPTSLAFGRGARDRKSVYVVNSGLFARERGAGAPGVVRARLDVAGFPAR